MSIKKTSIKYFQIEMAGSGDPFSLAEKLEAQREIQNKSKEKAEYLESLRQQFIGYKASLDSYIVKDLERSQKEYRNEATINEFKKGKSLISAKIGDMIQCGNSMGIVHSFIEGTKLFNLTFGYHSFQDPIILSNQGKIFKQVDSEYVESNEDPYIGHIVKFPEEKIDFKL
jgi:hypothetical protein